MLKELKITNLAIIEKLQISFSDGLVVLTGETGAGKSVILQAIYLLSGGSATSSWIRTGADTSAVEAFFECPPDSELLSEIQNMGVETDGTIAIKRILSRKGKSRFYINGSFASAKMAGEITENLLSVASQHDHQQLVKPAMHLEFIDSVGDLRQERGELSSLYDQWKALTKEFSDLKQQEMDKEQRRDFLLFQRNEITDAGICAGEDEELLLAKDRLRASEDLMRLGKEGYDLLAGNVLDDLARLRKNLEQMAGFDTSLAGFAEEVAGYSFQLEDSATRLRRYLEIIPDDPSQLETITARLHLLQQLKRKYGASLEDVLVYGEKAGTELESLDAMDQRLEVLEGELANIAEQLLEKAAELSAKRKNVSAELQQTISRELHSLAFDHVSFVVQFHESENPGLADLRRNGWDSPEFMFSANPGVPVKPVAKIASGGELSRLMLALKCVLAGKDRVESVIFDEVDAGISGKAAESVARKIRELSAHHQVICITHLPQIASQAKEHFLVTKEVSDQNTRTRMRQLSPDERIHELARMLDGDSVTEKTLEYARELAERKR